MLDVWVDVETRYDSYNLFSESYCCFWIVNWFYEKVEDLDAKFKKEPSTKIEYSVMNEFFHDCLELTLDPQEYVRCNQWIIPQDMLVDGRTLNTIQYMAGRIVHGLYENRNDLLSLAEYRLSIEIK